MDALAPGDLALVQRFVNTADLETGADDLSDADALAAWLAQAKLAPAPPLHGQRRCPAGTPRRAG